MSDPANVNPAGVASHDLTSLLSAEEMGQATLLRIVGQAIIIPGDASAVTEGVLAITQVGGEAALAGAFPEPANDSDERWWWWHRFLVGTGATGELGTGEATVIPFDIRPNRRIRERDEIVLLAENDDGTHTFLVAVGARTLIRLA